jgi:hypothetical protein
MCKAGRNKTRARKRADIALIHVWCGWGMARARVLQKIKKKSENGSETKIFWELDVQSYNKDICLNINLNIQLTLKEKLLYFNFTL